MELYQTTGESKASRVGPKVEAALRCGRAGGRAVIASLLDAAPAMRSDAGKAIAAAR
jgi:carbamate kinase